MPAPTHDTGTPMTRSAIRSTATLLTLALAVLPALGQSDLQARMDQVVRSAQIGDAVVGYAVVDARTGQLVAGHNENKLFIPASNQKLITTGAALLTLGPDYSFTTALLAAGPEAEGEPERLVLVGSGDPALGDPVILGAGDPPLGPDEVLAHLAAAAHLAVPDAGELIIDDRIFDQQTVHPSWPANQLNEWYCAEVAGLNFRTNTIDVYLRAGASGNTAAVETVIPDASWIQFDNRTRSATRGDRTAWISKPVRTRWRHAIIGNVVGRTKISVSIHDPSMFTGRLLAESIGDIPDTPSPEVRRAEPGENFGDARKVAAVHTRLTDILRRVNVNSHNLYAEAVLKHLDHRISGQPGSWDSAAAQVRAIISEHMTPQAVASVRIADGSGMSRDNRCTPAFLAGWIAKMLAKREIAPTFLDVLPTVGEGTLRNRFQDIELTSNVVAKSGFLNGVYTLSGVVTDSRTGRPMAFSVLVNEGSPSTRMHPKELHELLVDEIDNWLATERRVPFGG